MRSPGGRPCMCSASRCFAHSERAWLPKVGAGASDEERLAISSEAVAQNSGQDVAPVGDVLLPFGSPLASVRERLDDISQRLEAEVDVDALNLRRAGGLGPLLSLASRQVRPTERRAEPSSRADSASEAQLTSRSARPLTPHDPSGSWLTERTGEAEAALGALVAGGVAEEVPNLRAVDLHEGDFRLEPRPRQLLEDLGEAPRDEANVWRFQKHGHHRLARSHGERLSGPSLPVREERDVVACKTSVQECWMSALAIASPLSPQRQGPTFVELFHDLSRVVEDVLLGGVLGKDAIIPKDALLQRVLALHHFQGFSVPVDSHDLRQVSSHCERPQPHDHADVLLVDRQRLPLRHAIPLGRLARSRPRCRHVSLGPGELLAFRAQTPRFRWLLRGRLLGRGVHRLFFGCVRSALPLVCLLGGIRQATVLLAPKRRHLPSALQLGRQRRRWRRALWRPFCPFGTARRPRILLEGIRAALPKGLRHATIQVRPLRRTVSQRGRPQGGGVRLVHARRHASHFQWRRPGGRRPVQVRCGRRQRHLQPALVNSRSAEKTEKKWREEKRGKRRSKRFGAQLDPGALESAPPRVCNGPLIYKYLNTRIEIRKMDLCSFESLFGPFAADFKGRAV
eukprot:scaffold2677_cov220-Pinguiococcus_pyrenoidosus.AAC.6